MCIDLLILTQFFIADEQHPDLSQAGVTEGGSTQESDGEDDTGRRDLHRMEVCFLNSKFLKQMSFI